MPIPQAKQPRFLAASIVRKPPQVVTAILQTLAWQRLKKGTLDILLQPNFSAADPFAIDALKVMETAPMVSRETIPSSPMSKLRQGTTGMGPDPSMTTNAFERVAALKDGLLRYGLEQGYDGVWLIDADVLCDPYTCKA